MSVDSSPTWAGDVVADGEASTDKHGKLLVRQGSQYRTGNITARIEGVDVARLTYEVYPMTSMVLLGNVDADSAGDNSRAGAGRAMLDQLDELYPAPPWWLAADARDSHTDDGLRLIRSRRKPHRRTIHTSDCERRLDQGCDCEFS